WQVPDHAKARERRASHAVGVPRGSRGSRGGRPRRAAPRAERAARRRGRGRRKSRRAAARICRVYGPAGGGLRAAQEGLAGGAAGARFPLGSLHRVRRLSVSRRRPAHDGSSARPDQLMSVVPKRRNRARTRTPPDTKRWIATLIRVASAHPAIEHVLDTIARLSDRPVRTNFLLLGEPGTGKEGLARALAALVAPDSAYLKPRTSGR